MIMKSKSASGKIGGNPSSTIITHHHIQRTFTLYKASPSCKARACKGSARRAGSAVVARPLSQIQRHAGG